MEASFYLAKEKPAFPVEHILQITFRTIAPGPCRN